MTKAHTKEAAEAVLRELPSVVGAYVREDVYGHPREVHLLVSPGPDARMLARDIRDLLEEKLGVPVDQRVISIAQLSEAPDEAGERVVGEVPEFEERTRVESETETDPRLRFAGLEMQTREGRVLVRIRLEWKSQIITGEAGELDAGIGRLRATAAAALNAVGIACRNRIRFQLESASTVRSFGRDYVIAVVHTTAPAFGRRPIMLTGAHPIEDDPDHAAALAALKAVNRVAGRCLG